MPFARKGSSVAFSCLPLCSVLGGAACGPAREYCLQLEWEESGKELLGWEDQNDLEIVSFYFFFFIYLREHWGRGRVKGRSRLLAEQGA